MEERNEWNRKTEIVKATRKRRKKSWFVEENENKKNFEWTQSKMKAYSISNKSSFGKKMRKKGRRARLKNVFFVSRMSLIFIYCERKQKRCFKCAMNVDIMHYGAERWVLDALWNGRKMETPFLCCMNNTIKLPKKIICNNTENENLRWKLALSPCSDLIWSDPLCMMLAP